MEIIRVSPGDLTSSEVLERLNRGQRVLTDIELLDRTKEMSIREWGGTYYCNAPMKLFTCDTEEELQTCLKRYHLAKSGDVPYDKTDQATDPS